MGCAAAAAVSGCGQAQAIEGEPEGVIEQAVNGPVSVGIRALDDAPQDIAAREAEYVWCVNDNRATNPVQRYERAFRHVGGMMPSWVKMQLNFSGTDANGDGESYVDWAAIYPGDSDVDVILFTNYDRYGLNGSTSWKMFGDSVASLGGGQFQIKNQSSGGCLSAKSTAGDDTTNHRRVAVRGCDSRLASQRWTVAAQ